MIIIFYLPFHEFKAFLIHSQSYSYFLKLSGYEKKMFYGYISINSYRSFYLNINNYKKGGLNKE
ncbi:hypothetical protein PFTANZ_03582 [Plasmodium falciparum Tanzania (2000708)]|uniref:Uncharacterized protein n=2 Tax=Plasmodium falciparum TaxID=5833 RepID=A0A024W5A3_PLAFA|nr:hypothetical protein PFFVO_05523 [Plasmodium falciparum Vietnam Oak-Knoll (FVO)]ETW35710.1 hypothetical protein PFTANZ_03582 [Plasmodium falciparum Tanzania (2000708)]